MGKIVCFIIILLIPGLLSFCQDNSNKTFIKETSSESFTLKYSYKSLPKFIREYLNERNGKKFKINKRKFNSSDVNATDRTSRKLSYVGISRKYYILSYEHGGKSYHEHSIIFEINSGQVVNVYNFITSTHNDVTQLKYFFANELYSIQTSGEM
jgi:hypothetical protein